MASNRLSTASDRSNRWSMPALAPLPDRGQRGSVSNAAPNSHLQNAPKGNRNNRGSISGTSYGKSDFGVPLPAPPPAVDRRASRRISRISKLSDVSEVESERIRSRTLSTSVMGDSDNGGGGRRMSTRRMSLADDLGAESERRRSRRMSMMSTNSSVNRFSLMSRANNDWEQRAEPTDAPLSWDEDMKNPLNWELQKKTVNTLICCAISFVYTIALTAYSAATPVEVSKLTKTPIVGVLPYATYALGLIFGGSFANPFELAYGRKTVLLYSIPLFGLLLIGAGASASLIGVAVCRFLSAFFASPGLFLTYAVVSDIWIPLHETIGIACFVCSLVLGYAAGPIVGGVVIQYQSWKWTMWAPLFGVVLIMFAAIGMSETNEAAIKRKTKSPEQVAKEVAERKSHRVTRKPSLLKFKGNMLLGKAFSLLLSAPSLSMATLYVAYTTAMLITIPIFAPPKFAVFSFNDMDRGLTFAGTSGGVVVALVVLVLIDRYVHQPRVAQWEDEHDPYGEKGRVEMVENGKGGATHSSWRKGLAVTTRNLGLRGSTATDNTTARSESNASASSRGSRRSHRNSRRISSDGSNRRSRHMAFSERNINIAIAVTRFLNSQPANENKKIIVERVMVLLKNTDSYTTIASSLSQLGLVFEEALLAKVIVDALAKEKGGSSIGLYRSRSLHQLAAQAALMGGPNRNASVDAARNNSTDDEKRNDSTAVPLSPTTDDERQIMPPPEWRLLPALPATLLFPAGLAMFAWTCTASMPWIVPCVGLALAGLGGALGIYGVTAYVMQLYPSAYEATDAAAARTGVTMLTFLLGAGLPLVSVPMIRALGLSVGTTIFAGVGFAVGVLPWIIVMRGEKGRPSGAPATSREKA